MFIYVLMNMLTIAMNRMTTPMLRPSQIVALLHSRVGLNLYVLLNWALQGLEGPDNHCLISRYTP